jgi:hypothetical protein
LPFSTQKNGAGHLVSFTVPRLDISAIVVIEARADGTAIISAACPIAPCDGESSPARERW